MREISTEEIKIGEHVLIDGVEYVAEEADIDFPCKGCAFENDTKPCSDFISCHRNVYRKVKKEPKYRPYKDTDEMIADWKERFNAKDWPKYSMPLIWVVWIGWKSYIDGFREKAVCVKGFINDMDEVFRSCTYLDGTPCGKEVAE